MRTKRLRKMTPIAALTETLIRENALPGLKKHCLTDQPRLIFGPLIGDRIEEMVLEDNTLILHVPDSGWRRQLENGRGELLRKARAFNRRITNLLIEP